MTASIRVLGVPQLALRFTRAAAIGQVAANVAVDGLGTEVELRAKAAAPVLTGALRDSITYDNDGHVRVGVEYAPFVEYGTSDTPAQPYLRPAADTAEDSRALEAAATVMRSA